MPTLPLPPLFWTPPDEAGAFELRLGQTVAALAASLSEGAGIHIANAQFLTDPSAFLLAASYEDRYGPLGKAAVLMGKRGDGFTG